MNQLIAILHDKFGTAAAVVEVSRTWPISKPRNERTWAPGDDDDRTWGVKVDKTRNV